MHIQQTFLKTTGILIFNCFYKMNTYPVFWNITNIRWARAIKTIGDSHFSWSNFSVPQLFSKSKAECESFNKKSCSLKTQFSKECPIQYKSSNELTSSQLTSLSHNISEINAVQIQRISYCGPEIKHMTLIPEKSVH